MPDRRPNLLFVFADQWRADAFGYAGDPNVRTPNLDRFASAAVRVTGAAAGCPVCGPWRASLLTGRYPTSHGVVVNDVPLDPDVPSLGKSLRDAGYRTGWVGKWHVDGHGRSTFVPPARRHGFDFWRGYECTHNYFASDYHAGDDPTPRRWPGYDAFAQTQTACEFLRHAAGSERPFAMFLSWGPPHDPYLAAPANYRAGYDPRTLRVRPNVPPTLSEVARMALAGYYAHCTALDDAFGRLWSTLDDLRVGEDTLFVFTSDHGDLLGSHAGWKKQQPYDESVRVPMLVRWPARFGNDGADCPGCIDAPDLMPTLLRLLGVECPPTVQGADFSDCLGGGPDPTGGSVLLNLAVRFGEWLRINPPDCREYRGVRTPRHTYVRDLLGPWLLFDNVADPYQQVNLAGLPEAGEVRAGLDRQLTARLRGVGDDFEPGHVYLDRFGWQAGD